MAYDKVIDSAQLDAALTATANAIREKTGGTEALEWITDKGFADIISGISAGGGKTATGSYIRESEGIMNITVTHNLGVIPNFFLLFSSEVEPIEGQRYFKEMVLFCRNVEDTGTYINVIKGLATKVTSNWSYNGGQNGSYVITENKAGTGCMVNMCSTTEVRFVPHWSSYDTYCQAGKTYEWLVGVI